MPISVRNCFHNAVEKKTWKKLHEPSSDCRTLQIFQKLLTWSFSYTLEMMLGYRWQMELVSTAIVPHSSCMWATTVSPETYIRADISLSRMTAPTSTTHYNLSTGIAPCSPAGLAWELSSMSRHLSEWIWDEIKHENPIESVSGNWI